jgi:hypothetical protein
MKFSKLARQLLFTSVIAFIIFLAGSNNLFAGGIATTHGHSGHIEYQDNVDSSRQFLGWGLDFDQALGTWNWIHYSIPVPFGAKTRKVGVLFKTGSADVGITTIDIFDGDVRIHREDGLNLSGDKQWYIVDMGELKTIDEALGISIEVGAGVESMSHRVYIIAAGAAWQ